MACPRVQYRRRTHYATRSNRMKLVRTPGNKLVMQKRGKRSQGPHCPWVLGHKRLAGTKALGHFARRTESRYRKTVSRPYGGVLTHDQVRDRIVRAFLVEEQRIVRKVMKAEAKFQLDKKRRDKKQKKRVSRFKAASKKVGVKKTAGKKPAPAKKSTKKAAAPVGAKVSAKKKFRAGADDLHKAVVPYRPSPPVSRSASPRPTASPRSATGSRSVSPQVRTAQLPKTVASLSKQTSSDAAASKPAAQPSSAGPPQQAADEAATEPRADATTADEAPSSPPLGEFIFPVDAAEGKTSGAAGQERTTPNPSKASEVRRSPSAEEQRLHRTDEEEAQQMQAQETDRRPTPRRKVPPRRSPLRPPRPPAEFLQRSERCSGGGGGAASVRGTATLSEKREALAQKARDDAANAKMKERDTAVGRSGHHVLAPTPTFAARPPPPPSSDAPKAHTGPPVDLARATGVAMTPPRTRGTGSAAPSKTASRSASPFVLSTSAAALPGSRAVAAPPPIPRASALSTSPLTSQSVLATALELAAPVPPPVLPFGVTPHGRPLTAEERRIAALKGTYATLDPGFHHQPARAGKNGQNGQHVDHDHVEGVTRASTGTERMSRVSFATPQKNADPTPFKFPAEETPTPAKPETPGHAQAGMVESPDVTPRLSNVSAPQEETPQQAVGTPGDRVPPAEGSGRKAGSAPRYSSRASTQGYFAAVPSPAELKPHGSGGTTSGVAGQGGAGVVPPALQAPPADPAAQLFIESAARSTSPTAVVSAAALSPMAASDTPRRLSGGWATDAAAPSSAGKEAAQLQRALAAAGVHGQLRALVAAAGVSALDAVSVAALRGVAPHERRAAVAAVRAAQICREATEGGDAPMPPRRGSDDGLSHALPADALAALEGLLTPPRLAAAARNHRIGPRGGDDVVHGTASEDVLSPKTAHDPASFSVAFGVSKSHGPSQRSAKPLPTPATSAAPGKTARKRSADQTTPDKQPKPQAQTTQHPQLYARDEATVRPLRRSTEAGEETEAEEAALPELGDIITTKRRSRSQPASSASPDRADAAGGDGSPDAAVADDETPARAGPLHSPEPLMRIASQTPPSPLRHKHSDPRDGGFNTSTECDLSPAAVPAAPAADVPSPVGSRSPSVLSDGNRAALEASLQRRLRRAPVPAEAEKDGPQSPAAVPPRRELGLRRNKAKPKKTAVAGSEAREGPCVPEWRRAVDAVKRDAEADAADAARSNPTPPEE